MSSVGENGFQDWKENPDNPSFALRWKRIHGVYLCFLFGYSQTSYCCTMPMCVRISPNWLWLLVLNAIFVVVVRLSLQFKWTVW